MIAQIALGFLAFHAGHVFSRYREFKPMQVAQV